MTSKMGKIITKIKSMTLPPIAVLAGLASGRPVSGLWLARYFVGIGGEVSLPNKLERQIKHLVLNEGSESCRNDDCFLHEEEYGIADPNCPDCSGSGSVQVSIFTPRPGSDLYSCVGTFTAHVLEDGSIEYRDPYDWHEGMNWKFEISIAGLPFKLDVSGKDANFSDLGREFLTHGIIEPEATPLPLEERGGFSVSNAKESISKAICKKVRRAFGGKVSTTDLLKMAADMNEELSI